MKASVHSSEPVAEECSASGPGLTGKFTAQQVPTEFTILAAGLGGVRCPSAGLADKFKVTMRGSGKCEPTLSAGEESMLSAGDGGFARTAEIRQAARLAWLQKADDTAFREAMNSRPRPFRTSAGRA